MMDVISPVIIKQLNIIIVNVTCVFVKRYVVFNKMRMYIIVIIRSVHTYSRVRVRVSVSVTLPLAESSSLPLLIDSLFLFKFFRKLVELETVALS